MDEPALPLPAHWPVLGVCGYQNAGKTTLLEAAIPRLVARGLRVGVVKADAHGIDVDRPGKDSDRLFRAGASVALCGPGEAMLRAHTPGKAPLRTVLAALLRHHDVVLVEGHKAAALPKLWLHREAGEPVPEEAREIVATLAWQPLAQRLPRLLAEVEAALDRAAKAQPRYVGLLIGGASRRMGRAKHRLRMPDGRELLEHLVERLSPLGQACVLLGSPEEALAPSVAKLPRLPDVFDLGDARRGPLAGICAALRFAPEARWLFAACDQPALQANGARWLFEQDALGTWGVMGSSAGHARPLPCVLDGRLSNVAERLLHEGGGPRRLAQQETVRTVELPARWHPQWQDVDTPEQWHSYLATVGDALPRGNEETS